MRTRRSALPGHLAILSSAFIAHKGGGGVPSASSIPAYNPPAAPTPTDSPVTYEVARDYFKNTVYKGNEQAFSDPWNQEFNAWTKSLEVAYGKDYADGYKDLTYGQMTGAVKPAPTAGGSTPPVDLPPELNIPEVPTTPLTPNLPSGLTGGDLVVGGGNAGGVSGGGVSGGGTGTSILSGGPAMAQGDGLTLAGDKNAPVAGQMGGLKPVTPPAPSAPVLTTNETAQGRDTTTNAAGQTLVSMPTPMQPIPPVTDRLSEIVQAGREAKRGRAKRKGMASTLFAGETGGYSGPVKSLLGQ